MKRKSRNAITIFIVAILVVGALFFALISFITDFLWFRELGYVSVFLTKLFTQLKIGIPVFLIVTLLSFLYLQALKRGYYKKIESADNNPKTLKVLTRAAMLLSAIFGAAVTYFMVTQTWFEMLKFTNRTGFDLADPLFNLDISFYVFQLELINQLNTILIGVIIGFAALSVVYYLFLMSFRKPQMFTEDPDDGYNDFEDEDDDEDDFQQSQSRQQSPFGQFGDIFEKLNQMLGGGGGRSTGKQPQRQAKKIDDESFGLLLSIASKQLLALGVLFFLMLGVNFFLRQFELLYSSTGVLYGAGFTDVNITLWMYRILIVLSLAGAIGFVRGVVKKKFRTILTVPVIMIVVGLVGLGTSFVIQNYVVQPDEINKERTYLARNIMYTQTAYNLNAVDIREFAADNRLDARDVANNMETISNIRINDYEPVRRFYNNVQTIRPYYVFTDVFVDRYMVNGEYTQVYISAREIDDTARSPIPQTFLNRHIKYTHGYGITLSRVDQITASGQPAMLIRNIPPESDVDEIQILNPSIYFGKMTNDFILVNTTEPEFDYPRGATEAGGNAEAFYDGDAGIRLNFINKVMFSVRERNLRLLVSGALTSDSKIVINRNIEQRVRTIMPRLSYDPDPYMVTVNGQLFWIVDAYTMSTRYPYSEPFGRDLSGGVNYIRNSVKIVIDAFNGDTTYYLVDDTDPIALTYQSIFPALFKDFDDMPDEMKKHIRYPNLLLNIQANVYRRYHMSDIVMFYQNEDLWDIAREIYEVTEQPMVPNYYVMKLAGEEKAEFVNTIPFTPRDRLNLTALLIARNDMPHYGELILLRMPSGRQISGPMQIEAQIDQHPVISQDFSLWSQSGSTYSRGNLFIVPIEQSLIYVEPIYLEAVTSSIPEVKKVIVAFVRQDGADATIAYQDTLSESLYELFGDFAAAADPDYDPGDSGDPGSIEDPSRPPISDVGDQATADLIRLADQAFNNAMAAQRAGDWAAYGRYMGQVESYLSQLMLIDAVNTVSGNTTDQGADEE